MSQKLALRCHLEKSSQVKQFPKWITEIRRIDDLMCNEKSEFEALAKSTREAGRRTNTLSEPSRRANNTNYPSNQHAQSSNATGTRPTLPRLTESERQLLYDNEGCLKCRRVFVPHHSQQCPNDFPNPTSYKTLTQAFIDSIRNRLKRLVAAVYQSATEANTSSSVPTAPVAVVMGTAVNPVAYMPSNHSSVIEDGSDSEDVSFAVASVAVPAVPVSVIAPLTVPHMFWHCAISSANHCLPLRLKALIDHSPDQ